MIPIIFLKIKNRKIDEVSVGELIGDAIKRIHENKPVSPLFETKT